MRNFFTTELSRVVNLLFPEPCVFCGSPKGPICPICDLYIKELLSLPRCPVCGTPYMGDTHPHLCQSCLKKPPPFKRLLFSIPYTEATKGPLLALKYRGERYALNLLKAFPPELKGYDVIVPVPLHKSRAKSRRFNQAGLIARYLSAMGGIPVDTSSCERVKNTRSLTELTEPERRKEIKEAFKVEKGAFRGKRVLAVDDVFTTGSTMVEFTKALKREGEAEEIDAYTLFRRFPT